MPEFKGLTFNAGDLNSFCSLVRGQLCLQVTSPLATRGARFATRDQSEEVLAA